MGGLFVPDHFEVLTPSPTEMNMASFVWGLSIAFSIFSAAKGTAQTRGVLNRTGKANLYVYMIWAEWITSLAIGPICWGYLWGAFEPSFWVFFSILCFWVIEVQCIIQIIINRIALLIRDQSHTRRLQILTLTIMGAINISVYCIWIPAQLQINPTYVFVNKIWDRCEKVIFAIMDVSLNVYFIYLVRSKLIANGLTKYNRLFYANCVMIGVSLSLDVILIGIMSYGNGFVYVQFHPLVYVLKLYIEMNMADLIAKTVRGGGDGVSGGGNHGSGGYAQQPSTNDGTVTGTAPRKSYRKSLRGKNVVGGSNGDNSLGGVRMQTFITSSRVEAEEEDGDGARDQDIQRTVEISVVHEVKDDDGASRTSSTEVLQKKFGIL